ncbi:MAG TPA: aminotransferase class V-fold PLP-dependent enzyme [Nitrososphaerales archaeon]|nr:aminotransferase class V-fold PLP-dependent enzyme [Nitrososphaerales archaeon]
MASPQPPHSGHAFQAAFKDLISLSRYVFRNEKSHQFVFTGTGTIGMESSVVSLVSRGDKTLTLSTGYFGHRMHHINQIHGAKADIVDYTNGSHADPDDLRKRLRTTRYKAVFMTHVDTSTSVCNPVRELLEECSNAGVFSIVDGVCSIGGVPFDFDRFAPDIAFTASQKAIAAPPGAVLIATSQKVLDYMTSRKSPIESYYMSLLNWKPVMDNARTYLATPATQVLLALREALLAVKEETLEKRWTRHRQLGELTRSKVASWGSKFVANDDCRADTLTSFWVDQGSAEGIQKKLEEDHGIIIARGLAEARDSMLRIGHFGILSPRRLSGALQSIGEVVGRRGLGRK